MSIKQDGKPLFDVLIEEISQSYSTTTKEKAEEKGPEIQDMLDDIHILLQNPPDEASDLFKTFLSSEQFTQKIKNAINEVITLHMQNVAKKRSEPINATQIFHTLEFALTNQESKKINVDNFMEKRIKERKGNTLTTLYNAYKKHMENYRNEEAKKLANSEKDTSTNPENIIEVT